MRIAVIDMGTNTFHLLIAELANDSHTIVYKDRVPVKVGEKGINKNEITPEAWGRAISTLKTFKKTADEFGVEEIFATATSAMRNAVNGEKLAAEIKAETGIETNIISGKKEAELILKGVRNALDLGEEKNLIMDIGGGSIEFIIANQSETFWVRSFEIGGQRLVEKFHHSDPIAPSEIGAIKQFFDEELAELIQQCNLHKPSTLVGCSGTFDTLSDIYQVANDIVSEREATEHPFPIESFKDIYQDLLIKVREERLKIPGMIEMRVDMIVVATILIDYLIGTLSIENLRVSAYALKEGVLINTLESVQNSSRS